LEPREVKTAEEGIKHIILKRKNGRGVSLIIEERVPIEKKDQVRKGVLTGLLLGLKRRSFTPGRSTERI